MGVPVRGERRSQQEEDLERGDQGAKPYPLAGTPKTARHGSYATGSVAGSRRPAVVFRPQPWRYAETVNHHRGPTKSVISWPTTVTRPAGHDPVMILLYQWQYGTWHSGWGGGWWWGLPLVSALLLIAGVGIFLWVRPDHAVFLNGSRSRVGILRGDPLAGEIIDGHPLGGWVT